MRTAVLLMLAAGCATKAPVRPPPHESAKPVMTEGAPREELEWATLSPETFARAKAAHKYIVLDGSAEWCHWCQVMEATTYHDPAVRKILADQFSTTPSTRRGGCRLAFRASTPTNTAARTASP